MTIHRLDDKSYIEDAPEGFSPCPFCWKPPVLHIWWDGEHKDWEGTISCHPDPSPRYIHFHSHGCAEFSHEDKDVLIDRLKEVWNTREDQNPINN